MKERAVEASPDIVRLFNLLGWQQNATIFLSIGFISQKQKFRDGVAAKQLIFNYLSLRENLYVELIWPAKHSEDA